LASNLIACVAGVDAQDLAAITSKFVGHSFLWRR
jgi:hypothetical protein